MRRLGAFVAALLLGALTVSGQGDDDRRARLLDEIARLTKQLEEAADAMAPAAEETVVPRIYEVNDIVQGRSDRPAPPGNLAASKYIPPAEDEPVEPHSVFEIDALIELIRNGVRPASWDTIEGADIAPRNDRLFVWTTPAVHRDIAAFLDWCRVEASRRVTVEVVAVPVTEAEATRLAAQPLGPSAEEAAALVQRALGAVTLSGWDGQLLSGREGRSMSYLADYDVEIAWGAAIGDPIPDEIFSGITAEVRPCLDDGAKGAVLHCRLDFTRVHPKPATHKTEHGPVELPHMRLTRVQNSFWAPWNRPVVAGGGTAGEDAVVFLVTVRKR